MGPYLTYAFFCEKFIIDRDDNCLSAIRIVTRVTTELPNTINLGLVIGLVPGEMRGDATITISWTSPAGKPQRSFTFPFRLADEDDTISEFAWAVRFPVSEVGVYWWELRLFEQLLTRLPMRVQLRTEDR
jgi:hypothetical protein